MPQPEKNSVKEFRLKFVPELQLCNWIYFLKLKTCYLGFEFSSLYLQILCVKAVEANPT